jgi:hypothetical protein
LVFAFDGDFVFRTAGGREAALLRDGVLLLARGAARLGAVVGARLAVDLPEAALRVALAAVPPAGRLGAGFLAPVDRFAAAFATAFLALGLAAAFFRAAFGDVVLFGGAPLFGAAFADDFFTSAGFAAAAFAVRFGGVAFAAGCFAGAGLLGAGFAGAAVFFAAATLAGARFPAALVPSPAAPLGRFPSLGAAGVMAAATPAGCPCVRLGTGRSVGACAAALGRSNRRGGASAAPAPPREGGEVDGAGAGRVAAPTAAPAGEPLVSGVAAGRPVRSCSAIRGSSIARLSCSARSGVSADLRHTNATTSLISGALSKRTIAVCDSTVSTRPVAPTA